MYFFRHTKILTLLEKSALRAKTLADLAPRFYNPKDFSGDKPEPLSPSDYELFDKELTRLRRDISLLSRIGRRIKKEEKEQYRREIATEVQVREAIALVNLIEERTQDKKSQRLLFNIDHGLGNLLLFERNIKRILGKEYRSNKFDPMARALQNVNKLFKKFHEKRENQLMFPRRTPYDFANWTYSLCRNINIARNLIRDYGMHLRSYLADYSVPTAGNNAIHVLETVLEMAKKFEEKIRKDDARKKKLVELIGMIEGILAVEKKIVKEMQIVSELISK